MAEFIDKIKQIVIAGKFTDIDQAVEEALAAGAAASQILHEALIPAIELVGQRFADNKIFIPEMMLSGRTMQAGVDVLAPHLVEGSSTGKGRVVVATVHGDLHDIGKNLVKLMLEGNGFQVVDLGINVEAEKIVAAVQEHQPVLLMLSALLTTTMPQMQKVIELLNEKGLRAPLKVMVGGAPLSQAFATGIGADGYAEDAAKAVFKAKELVAGAEGRA